MASRQRRGRVHTSDELLNTQHGPFLEVVCTPRQQREPSFHRRNEATANEMQGAYNADSHRPLVGRHYNMLEDVSQNNKSSVRFTQDMNNLKSSWKKKRQNVFKHTQTHTPGFTQFITATCHGVGARPIPKLPIEAEHQLRQLAVRLRHREGAVAHAGLHEPLHPAGPLHGPEAGGQQRAVHDGAQRQRADPVGPGRQVGPWACLGGGLFGIAGCI